MEDERTEEELELETLEVETLLVEAEVEPLMPAKAKYYEELFRGGK